MTRARAGDWGWGKLLGASLPKAFLTCSMLLTLAGCFESGSDGNTATAVPSTQTPVNRPPEISGVPSASVQAGQAFSFVPTASDADKDFLEFAVTNKPEWAQFSVETGALNGTPNDVHVGQSSDITITVTDGRDQRSIGPFRITVTARNQTPPPSNTAPTISGVPAGAVDVNKPYSFQPSAADADGDALTFSISNRPSWASFSTATGLLSGTPTAANTFSNIVISVGDGKVSTSLPAFTIQVKGPTNRAPSISGAPGTSVQATQAYSFQPSASDPDGDTLTYEILNQPKWASFSKSTGRLSGTPTKDEVGRYENIVISVSDGKATASLSSFAITVQSPPNRAPTINGSPATSGKVGAAYSFQPTASDPDGDTLGYTISNRPAWATFDTANGRLSGTPTSAGTFAGIVISVSDGKETDSLAAFTITVSDNKAPTISGTPPTSVTVNSAYNFQPTAADADGDALTWSIQNKPTWAAFDASTGRLSGTPTGTGTFADIVISVSDTKTSTQLPGFTITVTQVTLGTATLSWQAPTQNTDGSAISGLAGYRIVYGKSPTSLTQTIEVTNPSVTTYVVDQLTSATWYFAVKAYTSQGVESDLSNVGSKTIP